MDKRYLKKLISAALREDIGGGDVTTTLLFPEQIKVKAKIVAKQNGVVCGMAVAEEVFKAVEKKIRTKKGKRGIKKEREGYIRFYSKVKDGAEVKKGQVICVVEGDARAILAAERTVLNFLGRLSGIATLTRRYVDAIRPYEVKIMDTRKTTPGLRQLEKYAVRCGGGVNHRMGLWDQVLVKDNHLVALKVKGKRLKVKEIIKRIKKDKKGIKGIKKGIKIEIEAESLKEFKEALAARPDIIMLDNMRIAEIKKAVTIKNTLHTYTPTHLHTKLEVSGGVTLANVRAIAKTGVDMLSIGALTHSASSLDFSLEIAC